MKEIITNILTLVNETISGEGAVVNTGSKKTADGPSDAGRVTTSHARFLLNCTGITGTSMLISIVAVINGVDIIIDSFTAVSAIGQQSLLIEDCPVYVKAVYTETAITDFDCTIDSIRY